VVQESINPTNADYPFMKKITVQTNHEINPVSIAVIFSGAPFDRNAVVGFGVNATSMEVSPRSWIGHDAQNNPAVIAKFSSTPPMSPSVPLILTIQSRSDFQVQRAMEYFGPTQ
jgi:hypothetical protein